MVYFKQAINFCKYFTVLRLLNQTETLKLFILFICKMQRPKYGMYRGKIDLWMNKTKIYHKNGVASYVHVVTTRLEFVLECW